MQHPDPRGTGARDRNDADASLAGDASVSNKSRAPIQARPLGPGDQAALEARIEQLAYGEALPDNLTEIRRTWWNLARQGVRLPAQLGLIVIAGGAL